jgi:hypothetical protein
MYCIKLCCVCLQFHIYIYIYIYICIHLIPVLIVYSRKLMKHRDSGKETNKISLIFCILGYIQIRIRCTGHKISLTYMRGEGKMERARGEQDTLCAIAFPPSPYLNWLATVCICNG